MKQVSLTYLNPQSIWTLHKLFRTI